MKTMLKKGLSTLSLMMVLLAMTFAQNITITGTITDAADASPLPGANVNVKGTTQGTISDIDGTYEIQASPGATLIYSYVGYETQEIIVNASGEINVEMLLDSETLDEIVVVGFGTQKKENVTGANTFVKMDQLINDRPIVNSAQALQGVAPGLQVTSGSGQPGSTETSINIRGFTSINGGSPLVLVDNVPMSLNDVNPRDIESISVLKDASASSIYGSRAAFGVILITTKKADRNQPTKFSYQTTNSLSSPSDLPVKASTREFVESLRDFGEFDYFAGQNVETWLNYLDSYESNPSQLNLLTNPVSGDNYPIVFDEATNTYYPVADSDIIGDFLNDNGFSTIHNLTMSGGSDKIAYRINGGYSYEDGIMVTDRDSYGKYNVNAYLGADLSSRLKSTTNIFYRNSSQSRPIAQYNNAIQLRMYDPTGFFETSAGDVIPFESPGNVVRYRTPSTTIRNNLRIFQKLEYELADNFSVVGEYTNENSFTETQAVNNGVIFASTFRFIPNTTAENAFQNSRITQGRFKTDYTSLNIYGKYKKDLGDHNFELLSGFNREGAEITGFSATRTGLIDPTLPTFNLSIGEVFDISDSFADWRVLGYFGRINYNYKEKYFLEVNGRYDGSSRFPSGNRFVFLPSVSAGWNIARESFISKYESISLLKIRASWGEIGNQNTPDYYPAIPGYEDYNASWIDLNTGQRYLTLEPAQLVSNSFTWEKVRTTNLGVDLGLFNDRFSASFDVFRRETIGMLAEGLDLPAILGTEAPDQNIADLRTTGWEFELGWKDRKGDFKYGLNFNLFDNTSKITNFLNESGLIDRNYVGREIGEIWGYVTDGYYTIDDLEEGTLYADLSGPNRQLRDGVAQIENAPIPFPGDIKYQDLNGDGVINFGNNSLIVEFDDAGNPIPNTGPGDRQIIGNSTRRYQFGINGNIGYKGLDLSFLLSGVAKRDLWRNSDLIWPFPGTFDHIYKHQLDYWTPDNQDAYYPRVYGNPVGNTQSNYSRSRRVQTKYLSDESYLRIQNITIGYTLPSSLTQRMRVDNLRLFLAGNNLFTFDNLPKGLDPDQGSNGVYPIMKNYSFGLNLNF